MDSLFKFLLVGILGLSLILIVLLVSGMLEGGILENLGKIFGIINIAGG